MELALSKEMLGRVFNGAGRPIDGLGELYPEEKRDVNGMAMNPVARRIPQQLHLYRHIRYRLHGHADPRPKAAHLLRRRYEPQPVGSPDRAPGQSSGESDEKFRHRLCRYGAVKNDAADYL